MDNFRALIKKSPAAVVMQVLRTTMLLPQPLADGLISELTQPTSKEKKWIKKINNSYWKGILIAPNMRYDSDAEAIRRLRTADVVIFEVHGGGFRVGNSAMYMSTFTKWIKLFESKHGVKAVIMSIEYGLAPEHKYPEPIIDVVKAFKHLVHDLCVPPWKVVACGDSAGGAIGIEALIRYYAPGMLDDLDAPRTNFSPMPAGLVASSPVLSDKVDSDSWKQFEKEDMVSKSLVDLIFKEFFDVPKVDPSTISLLRLAEIRQGFERFIPKNLLVFVGDREVMRDHIVDVLEAVEADGYANVRLYREDYGHDWYFIREIVKKKDKKMLDRYDEIFVDFVVSSVAEATEASVQARSARKISLSINSDDKRLSPEIEQLFRTAETVRELAKGKSDVSLQSSFHTSNEEDHKIYI